MVYSKYQPDKSVSPSSNIYFLSPESPKRQCFRDVEQTLKPDTPAIQGVQSRAKDLSHLLTKDNNEGRIGQIARFFVRPNIFFLNHCFLLQKILKYQRQSLGKVFHLPHL